MKATLLLVLITLFLSHSVYSISSVGYDFAGNAGTTFTLEVDNGDGTWSQSGGVGQFTSTSGSFTDPTLIWQTYQLPYDSDWEVSLEITMPTFYDTDLADPDSGDEFVDAFLGVRFEDSFNTEYIATSGLSVSSFNGGTVMRNYFGEFILNGSAQFGTPMTTSLSTVTSKLTFDSITKIITAFGDSNELFTLDVVNGDPGWNMTSGDFFSVGIRGTNNFNAVSSGNPIVVDNLSAIGASAIPEPGMAVLLIGLLGASWVFLKRRC
jgi:hypothetical protein